MRIIIAVKIIVLISVGLAQARPNYYRDILVTSVAFSISFQPFTLGIAIVVLPIQPTASGKAIRFKIHLEPFDESYGDLGNFKVIVVTGNPMKYKLVPTEAQIPNKALPKRTGQSETNER